MKWLLIFCLLTPFQTEEEPVETPEPSTEEPAPEPEPEPTQNITVNDNSKEAAQMVIDYLEERREEEARLKEEEEARLKEEQEEAEKAAEEEAEAAAAAEEEANQQKLLAIEREIENADYSSQNNVIYGYAENYKYYLAYSVIRQDGYYTRTDRYIYVFDPWTKFSIEGGKLKFQNGECLKVSYPYQGYVTTQKITAPITFSGLYDAYSNISVLSLPALYQVNKSAIYAWEEFLQIIIVICSLFIGWRITYRLIK